MKKIIVSTKKLRDIPEEFRPAWYANRFLLQTDFGEGKIALVKYSRGKLSIKIPNEIDRRINEQDICTTTRKTKTSNTSFTPDVPLKVIKKTKRKM